MLKRADGKYSRTSLMALALLIFSTLEAQLVMYKVFIPDFVYPIMHTVLAIVMVWLRWETSQPMQGSKVK